LKKQEATGDAKSEAENIEDGKPFSLRQISHRKRQVIFEHVVSVFFGMRQILSNVRRGHVIDLSAHAQLIELGASKKFGYPTFQ